MMIKNLREQFLKGYKEVYQEIVSYIITNDLMKKEEVYDYVKTYLISAIFLCFIQKKNCCLKVQNLIFLIF